MSEIPTPAHDTTPDLDGEASLTSLGGVSGRPPKTWRLTTYYRLWSIALETRVRALEDELAERERQLDAAVAQYERVLQRPDEDWAVTTSHGPDVQPED